MYVINKYKKVQFLYLEYLYLYFEPNKLKDAILFLSCSSCRQAFQ